MVVVIFPTSLSLFVVKKSIVKAPLQDHRYIVVKSLLFSVAFASHTSAMTNPFVAPQTRLHFQGFDVVSELKRIKFASRGGAKGAVDINNCRTVYHIMDSLKQFPLT